MSNYLRINRITKDMIDMHLPNNDILDDLTYFYSVFCDNTRLKILISLSITQMCVNDLSEALQINQTTISHQLKILRSAGVVTATRKNKFIFYRITNKFISSIMINGIDNLLSKVS